MEKVIVEPIDTEPILSLVYMFVILNDIKESDWNSILQRLTLLILKVSFTGSNLLNHPLLLLCKNQKDSVYWIKCTTLIVRILINETNEQDWVSTLLKLIKSIPEKTMESHFMIALVHGTIQSNAAKHDHSNIHDALLNLFEVNNDFILTLLACLLCFDSNSQSNEIQTQQNLIKWFIRNQSKLTLTEHIYYALVVTFKNILIKSTLDEMWALDGLITWINTSLSEAKENKILIYALARLFKRIQSEIEYHSFYPNIRNWPSFVGCFHSISKYFILIDPNEFPTKSLYLYQTALASIIPTIPTTLFRSQLIPLVCVTLT
jgi:hypothetical protein